MTLACIRRTSITDVAHEAGVSTATVSRTFSHPDAVLPATRDKVIAASRRLGFSISRTPGILKSGHSYRIALLIGSTEIEWYTAKVLEGLLSVLSPAGYDLTTVPITSVPQRKEFFDELPLRNNVDAVIASSFRINPREVKRLQTMNVPIVGLNVSSSAGFSATDSINDEKGMRLLLRHLAALGHRNILYVYQNFHSELLYSSMRRIRAFSRICGQLPSVTQHILNVPNDQDSNDSVLSFLLESENCPTAICFHQDSLAIPFFIALAREGVAVPRDLSITGFDDSDFAQQAGLTTIHQDPRNQAIQAAHMALDLIAGKKLARPNIEASTNLVIRSSTGAPRHTLQLKT